MLKWNSPGCPCCITACDVCEAIDSSLLEADWTEEAGTWIWAATYAQTSSNNALISRENATSEYRVATCQFYYASGTKNDAGFVLGMRDAAGDSIRVEVDVEYTYPTSTFTVNVYKDEDGSDTLLEGPVTFTSDVDPGAFITIRYDPDYDIVTWAVASATDEPAFGLVECDLALRDLIVGTKTLNSQTFIIGGVFDHSLCFGSQKAAIKHASTEVQLTLTGLAASATQMVYDLGGFAGSVKWLFKWAPSLNDTYSLGSMTSTSWYYDLPLGELTVQVDVDHYDAFGNFSYTETDADHYLSIEFWLQAFCYDVGNDIGIVYRLRLTLYYANVAGGYGGGVVVYFYSATLPRGKDLRTILNEGLTLVAGTGSNYLDWTGATITISAVNS